MKKDKNRTGRIYCIGPGAFTPHIFSVVKIGESEVALCASCGAWSVPPEHRRDEGDTSKKSSSEIIQEFAKKHDLGITCNTKPAKTISDHFLPPKKLRADG